MHLSIRALGYGITLAIGLGLSGCGDDDPSNLVAAEYDIVASEPRFIIPSAVIPTAARSFASNNNVDIVLHEERLFLAWRTAPSHFASTQTQMHILSSPDLGVTWQFEHTVALGTDVREPRLFVIGGVLHFLFFEAGSNPAAFEPKRIWRSQRIAAQQWTPIEVLTDAPEVPWDIKSRSGLAFLTSYQGEHYTGVGLPDIRVFLRSSSDGRTWSNVDGNPFVYRGGVSEAAFEFDSDGSLWAVTRNEDGDTTGFGSHVCFAPADALAQWQCSTRSDPERYDSPEMFRHENDIYLLARRDVGGPYDQGAGDLTFDEQRSRNLLDYSFRPKRTALYKLNKEARRVEHVQDLPGAGDTAFPSVVQTGPHTFLLANYTSPLDQPNATWFEGQTSPRGTQIYLLTLSFVERAAGAPQPTATPTEARVLTPTPGNESARKVVVAPVFAAPATPLHITWPMLNSFSGVLDLGDGSGIGPDRTTHEYAPEENVFALRASITSAGTTTTARGFVVRSHTLATSPLRRFTLVEPSDPLASGVIRNVIPAFYWARVGDRWAVASDPTAKAAFEFSQVSVASLTMGGGGQFVTDPTTLVVELSGARATASGLYVGLTDVRFSGKITDNTITSPVTMNARIVIQDLVTVLRQLGGFDEAQAVEFVAGVFDFDKNNPPLDAPFRGDLGVQP